MTSFSRALLLAVAAALTAGPAQAAGDAVTGARVAQTWCAACHTISTRGRAIDTAPGFPNLAQERTESQLRAFLTDPHGAMPNIQLSRQQIDDVIAYIKTLQRQ